MARFCSRCGSELDKNGQCPHCDGTHPKRGSTWRTAGDLNLSDSTTPPEAPPPKKPDKRGAKQKERVEKRAALTKKQKVKRFFVKLFLILLVLVVLTTGGLFALTYFDVVELPEMAESLGSSASAADVEKDIPETNMSGLRYYKSSEENIAIDNGTMYVNNEILVALVSEDQKPQLENYLDSVGGQIVGEIALISDYQILLPQSLTIHEIEQMVQKLESFDWVSYASPNYVMELDCDYVPNDEKWKGEWEDIPSGSNWGMEAIEAPGAWEYQNQMATVNIGIFDTVFDVYHEDLNFAEQPLCNLKAIEDCEWDSHGTHVSGTVSATFDNEKGVSGTAIKTKLYGASFKGLEGYEKKTSMTWKIGFCYLIANCNCKVINASWGYDILTFNASRHCESAENDLKELSQNISNFLQSLLDRGYEFVICKSAGNQNDVTGNYQYFRKDKDDTEHYDYISYEKYISYLKKNDKKESDSLYRYKDRKKEIEEQLECGNVDAKYDILGAIEDEEVKSRIIVVGSVEDLGTRRDGLLGIFGKRVHNGYKIAASSQCGERVDILAPGVKIYSAVKNGYAFKSGTSMASPHVAGVAGLLFSVKPDLTGKKVKEIIKSSGVGEYGAEKYKLLNAKRAVETALSITDSRTEIKLDHPSYAMPNISSTSRDIVLVLDASGSMSGTPMEETKKASVNFIETVLEDDASIGIVTYDNYAARLSDFSTDKVALENIISGISDGGGTNIEAGLHEAQLMLAESQAKKKIIVLMSDGEPNDGKEGDELVAYTDKVKSDGVFIYTLGFFESTSGNKSAAQLLMERIASDGCHYEVANADDLVFFFGDMADQINGQKYIYVRIACPVDVYASYHGEMLSSNADMLSTRTAFGTLTFEESENNEEDDLIKILRLKEGAEYDVRIQGTGRGQMDYTIGFQDENGDYSDLRSFKNIKITSKTKIDTVAKTSSSTELRVDEDGDGHYDLRYVAGENGTGGLVDNRWIFYTLGVWAVVMAIFIFTFVRKNRSKRRIKHV